MPIVRSFRFASVFVVALVLAMAPAALGGTRGVGAATASPSIVEVVPEGDPLAVARRLRVEPTQVYREVVNGFAAELTPAARRAAEADERIVSISPDLPVSIARQELPTGVDRIDADRHPDAAINGRGGGVDVDVAVIDTGIARHRELNVAGGTSCVDGNIEDQHGHGTHVAGTIGAKDDNAGVVGVAPGARLWSVKVFDRSGVSRNSVIVCGLDWVYEHRGTIDVVNMSLAGGGGDGPCSQNAYHKAICKVVAAGIPVVVAAGNGGQDVRHVVPATWDQTIAVSSFADSDGAPGGAGSPTTCSLRDDDTRVSYSNYGADVDIAAPGDCILSTSRSGGLTEMSGTSMAAPHVAGALALYKARHRGADAREARAWLLREAARPQDSVVGFAGDTDGSPEPVLYLGPQGTGSADGETGVDLSAEGDGGQEAGGG